MHQLPKTVRPRLSPRRLASAESVALRKLLANSKKSCRFLRCSDSMPLSMSSTSMRLKVSLWVFAKVRTCAVSFAGSVMYWRTVLSAGLIGLICTKMVRFCKVQV
jgi:hypothetical protein